MKKDLSITAVKRIDRIIYIIRGQKVMLDSDLAMLYGVETKAFNRAIDRNIDRFPEDFAFRLTQIEWKNLRCQIGTSSGLQNSLRCQFGTLDSCEAPGRGKYPKYLPRVFTEHGAYAAAFMLRSERAKIMSIEVVRAFVQMRKLLAHGEQFTKGLNELKSFVLKHTQATGQEFRKVWRAIEKLSEPVKPQERIGFRLN